ncbi:MAG: 2-phospho-L-lactate guanylyltransferase [Pseudomonadota bacterium]
MTGCLVVVPMKDPALSKTRLGPDLDPAARASLARLLLSRTLDLLTDLKAATAFDLAVVTASREVTGLAARKGVAVIRETERPGLNGALATAARHAETHGFRSFCALPADLAAPDPADILRLLSFAGEKDTAFVCPSVDRGTNALLVTPPNAMAFRFGAGSARRHLEEAEAQGLTARLLPLESLKYDIDTAAHLARAARRLPELDVS